MVYSLVVHGHDVCTPVIHSCVELCVLFHHWHIEHSSQISRSLRQRSPELYSGLQTTEKMTRPPPVGTRNPRALGSSEPTPEEPCVGEEGRAGLGQTPNWIPNRGVQGEPCTER